MRAFRYRFGAKLSTGLNWSPASLGRQALGSGMLIKSKGPGLIEGDHYWWKLVWQLSVGRGVKAKLAESPYK